MFLLRAAFWIGIVLVLLPSGGAKTQDEPSRLGALDALSAASSAVSDLSQFCDRQPGACIAGAHAASMLGDRAQAGARMVYEFLTEKMAPAETGSIGDKDAGRIAAQNSQHTLTSEDAAPAWRPAAAAPTFRAPLPRPKPDSAAAIAQPREKRS